MLNLILYTIVMAITPGPNTILSMANASAIGLKKGIWLNIGMLIGITCVTFISFFAVSLLSAFIPKAELFLKIIGSLYILYLAWKTYRKSTFSVEEKSAGFLEGLILQLINVKVYLLALTAISSGIMPMEISYVTKFHISFLIPIICFLSGLVWAVCGALLSKLFTEHRKVINTILALLLVYSAIRIFI